MASQVGPVELPVDRRGMNVSAHDLRVSADSTVFFEKVSFSARPGEIVIVIGPNGVGKTLFLCVLAGQAGGRGTRVTGGGVSYDGHPLTASIRTRLGYVPQEPAVRRGLTARHFLRAEADMWVPGSAATRDKMVEQVLDDVDMAERADRRVRKLSGGQQQRLVLASELLRRPDLLLLDEPTVGLDPAAVATLSTALRQHADDGATIVIVTHDAHLVTVADRFLVFARDGSGPGRLCFSGDPTGLARAFGVTDPAEAFRLVSTAPERMARSDAPTGAAELVWWDQAGHSSPARRGASWWRQVHIQAKRDWRSGPLLKWAAVALVAPAVTAIVFRGILGLDNFAEDGSGRPRLLLFLLSITGVAVWLWRSAGELVRERETHARETAVGVSVSAYLVAKVVGVVGVSVPQAAILAGALCGQQGPAAQWQVASGLFCLCLAANGLGLLVSAVARSEEAAGLTATFLVVAQLVCSGSLLPVDGPWQLVAQATPAAHGFTVLAVLEDLLSVDRQCLAGASSELCGGELEPTRANLATATGWLFIQSVVYLAVALLTLLLRARRGAPPKRTSHARPTDSPSQHQAASAAPVASVSCSTRPPAPPSSVALRMLDVIERLAQRAGF